MKILHIYKTYYPETLGGIEKTIATLTDKLSAQKVQSDVLTTTYQNHYYETTLNTTKVYFYPRTLDKFSCPISYQMFRQAKNIINQYDIVHYHFPWPFADCLHLFKHINKPSVLTYHSDIVRQKALNILYKPLMHRFLKKIDCIVTTSDNLLQSSLALQHYQKKTHVIPIGMDISAPPPHKQVLLEKWQQRLSQPFFLFIGVLRYYKGLHFLLEAIRDSAITIVIAGDGPEKNKLQALAQTYNLNNVIFTGKVSDADKWALLELCYGVIAPSHLNTEAFCISLLEGLMQQKPLISTELGTGTSFVNTHNISGIVVSPENPLALRNAMLKLLNDSEYYQQLKQNTLTHYNNHFTATTMSQKYFAIYEKLMLSYKI